MGHSSRVVAPLSAALVLALFGLACGQEVVQPHLFLITADALRADHTSLFGYSRTTTPNLDAFAGEAHRFPQAITLVPKTGPSFATHWTGLAPAAHRVTSNKFRLPADAPVLAEILKEHGYDTAAFVSNPILSQEKGFARGFDRYETFGKQEGLDELNAAFLAWAGAREWRRPTFVWIHYIDPHGPYTPPARYRDLFVDDALFRADERVIPLDYEVPEGWPPNRVLGAVPAYQRIEDEARAAWYVSQYDAEIRSMDAAFGEVLDFLREHRLYEQSGIFFTSDHGESMGEHDYFFEHGWFVYDATLRVPLVIKAPGRRDARSQDAQVSNLDTLPTLLAMSGIPIPPDLPGRDILAAPETTALLVQNPSTYAQPFFALRTPAHKYLREIESGAEELYLLEEDPAESRNLIADRPQLASRLREQLHRLRAEIDDSSEAAIAVEPSEEERALLERLGYTR
jgi:arylsulfatase